MYVGSCFTELCPSYRGGKRSERSFLTRIGRSGGSGQRSDKSFFTRVGRSGSAGVLKRRDGGRPDQGFLIIEGRRNNRVSRAQYF